jgi:hypothetical protein
VTAPEVHDEERDRRGEPVTAAGLPLTFVEQTGQWVELTPPDSEGVGFTVHEDEVVLTLPKRIVERINFAGPVPPAPLRPIGTPCWLWTGWHNDMGYGYVYWEGRDQPAHRIVHALVTGEDLTSLDRDHVCRVVSCVRPDHGEAVPHGENMTRLAQAQKKCRRAGHDWTDPNNVLVRKNGRRWCAECNRQDCRKRYAKRKAAK